MIPKHSSMQAPAFRQKDDERRRGRNSKCWETTKEMYQSVQFSRSVVSDSLRPHELQHARPPCLSPTPELTQTHVHWVGDAIQPLILCCPLLRLPPTPPSIRVFSNESTLRMRWQKYWSFSLNISPSNKHTGLISFRKDWLDLLAVQGTLKSLLQHHSSALISYASKVILKILQARLQ